MANFKVNEKVRVKATGKEGVIMAREVIELENNRNRVEYIVRLGNGFENWNKFEKKEIEKINNVEKVDNGFHKFYNFEGEYKDYILCMVAETHTEKDYWYANGDIKTNRTRFFNVGYSIYNPEDVFDEERGIKVARHRMKTSPFCHMMSSFTGEFNLETIEAIVDVKARYIINNADKFITKV